MGSISFGGCSPFLCGSEEGTVARDLLHLLAYCLGGGLFILSCLALVSAGLFMLG